MLPRTAVHDEPYGSVTHTDCICDALVRVPFLTHRANCAHVIICQFGILVCFAQRVSPAVAAVEHVVGKRADHQMSGVGARRVIACMPDDLSGFRLSVRQDVDKPVDFPNSAVETDGSVSFGLAVSGEGPAGIWSSRLVNHCPDIIGGVPDTGIFTGARTVLSATTRNGGRFLGKRRSAHLAGTGDRIAVHWLGLSTGANPGASQASPGISLGEL